VSHCTLWIQSQSLAEAAAYFRCRQTTQEIHIRDTSSPRVRVPGSRTRLMTSSPKGCALMTRMLLLKLKSAAGRGRGGAASGGPASSSSAPPPASPAPAGQQAVPAPPQPKWPRGLGRGGRARAGAACADSPGRAGPQSSASADPNIQQMSPDDKNRITARGESQTLYSAVNAAAVPPLQPPTFSKVSRRLDSGT
jgi:hypothetical protein